MRILLLNQTFYPDVASTAQHAADLASALAAAGHEVTVIASRHAYDSPSQLFARSETWRGVRILRIRSTTFGKSAHWRRALDFASFTLASAFRLALLRNFDVVIALTSPPLISAVAALYVRTRGGSLVSWIMDLNPDEAIAAAALRETSLLARGLSRLLKFSLSASAAIVVLDRFMRDRIVAKGLPDARIFILPPWSHDSVVNYDPGAGDRFRAAHGLSGKFVVMYSGNHSPCHPLDTVLHAAREMAAGPDVAFLFVGGGSEFRKVREFAAAHSLSNVQCLPYQPLESLAGSLSAADLHLVVMGDAFVGIVHPCKIYNILATGCPYLYVGPSPSHVTEVANGAPAGEAWLARHGDVEGVVACIRQAAALGQRRCLDNSGLARQFSAASLLSRMIDVVESCCPPHPAPAIGPDHLRPDAPESYGSDRASRLPSQ